MKLIRGLQSAQSMKNVTSGGKINMDFAHYRAGLTSAKLSPKGSTKTGETSDFTLPPILKPLLDEHLGKKKVNWEESIAKPSKKHGYSALKNKEANLRETAEMLPEAQGLLNMLVKQGQNKDPSDQLDPHKPARTMNAYVPNNVMNIEHNYCKKVKNHLRSAERSGRMAQTSKASICSTSSLPFEFFIIINKLNTNQK
jgi:hypothetical protein